MQAYLSCAIFLNDDKNENKKVSDIKSVHSGTEFMMFKTSPTGIHGRQRSTANIWGIVEKLLSKLLKIQLCHHKEKQSHFDSQTVIIFHNIDQIKPW